ncbi:DUF302 domain-containing protein [Pedobacter jamesrossensis]|uniref:DUF302 domain-containing protein n=1 Tax=Pedobacter jamesrossensis TaxID=1908238 RepID=A0ABV8NKU4_9SPHI
METLKNITIRQSNFTVEETLNRIAFFLQSKGITIYARIDQQNEMAKIGQKIRPMEFIMFGKPSVGFKAVSINPVIALDLPLKILVYENENGKVHIAYNEQGFLSERYKLDPSVASLFVLDAVVSSALEN